MADLNPEPKDATHGKQAPEEAREADAQAQGQVLTRPDV